jgi:hypothetical protein
MYTDELPSVAGFLNEAGTRLLTRAAVLGHRETVTVLLQHGAVPDESVWDAAEKSGQRRVLAVLGRHHAFRMVCVCPVLPAPGAGHGRHCSPDI